MRLVVADASALGEYLLDPSGAATSELIESEEVDLHAPALCDIEILALVRRALRQRETTLDVIRASDLLEDYSALPLTRHEHLELLPRIFSLRDNFSAYDASYAALAEALGAELLTADHRFACAARDHLALVVHCP